MKKIRTISPLVSALLAVILIAGNSGITFIFHNCIDCTTQEVMHSIEVAAKGSCNLCGESDHCISNDNSSGIVMHHHCQKEIERLMTSELVKTEVSNDINPFLPFTQIFLITPEEINPAKNFAEPFIHKKYGRRLATMYCQMLS